MPSEVYVHARFADGSSALVGIYRTVRSDAGRPYGEFQYVGSWLRAERDRSFALDPVNLPLVAGPFQVGNRNLLHGALADAIPDDWGKRLIGLTHPRGGPMTACDWLLATRDDRVGCLEFSSAPEAPQPRPAIARMDDLAGLAVEFERLAEGLEAGDVATRLWRAGASLGGARPKASVEFEGALWIAKFQRASDTLDQCAAESATMRLAGRCGIDVAETRIVQAGPRKAVLVMRFDRAEGSYRPTCHYLSGMSILGVDERSSDGSYSQLAGFLAREAHSPSKDRAELFRRMAFNVLCGNRDDHLKNHGFLRDGEGWRLAPAFDVVPQPDSDAEQAIGVGTMGSMATVSNCLSKASDFGLKPAAAQSIVDELLERMAHWRDDFAEDGVDSETIRRLERAFSPELDRHLPDRRAAPAL